MGLAADFFPRRVCLSRCMERLSHTMANPLRHLRGSASQLGKNSHPVCQNKKLSRHSSHKRLIRPALYMRSLELGSLIVVELKDMTMYVFTVRLQPQLGGWQTLVADVTNTLVEGESLLNLLGFLRSFSPSPGFPQSSRLRYPQSSRLRVSRRLKIRRRRD
jgi:hypothetical protein